MKKEVLFTEQKLQQIETNHQVFKESPCLTLRDEFLMGEWSNAKKQKVMSDTKTYAEMKSYMGGGQYGNYKQFGVYTKIECMYIYKRGLYISRIEHEHPGLLDNTNPSVDKLINTSLICRDYPSMLLPIKAIVLKKGLEKEYTGLQPVTKPVRRATEKLLGKADNYWNHMLMCNVLAEEWNTTPTHINTYFWLLGYAD